MLFLYYLIFLCFKVTLKLFLIWFACRENCLLTCLYFLQETPRSAAPPGGQCAFTYFYVQWEFPNFPLISMTGYWRLPSLLLFCPQPFLWVSGEPWEEELLNRSAFFVLVTSWVWLSTPDLWKLPGNMSLILLTSKPSICHDSKD